MFEPTYKHYGALATQALGYVRYGYDSFTCHLKSRGPELVPCTTPIDYQLVLYLDHLLSAHYPHCLYDTLLNDVLKSIFINIHSKMARMSMGQGSLAVFVSELTCPSSLQMIL